MTQPDSPAAQNRRDGPAKKAAAAVWRALRLAVYAVLLLELCSALVITVMNHVIYGQAREGSRLVYDSYTLYSSAEGMRETVQQPPAKPGGKRVIWFLGGSTMRGDSTDAAHTLPSILCRELNKELPCECLNFGVNSFNSMQEVQQLQKAQLTQEQWPDLIVFLDGANDASYSILFRNADAHEGYARIKGFVESYWSSPFGLLKPVAAALAASFTLELYSRLTYALLELGPDSLLPGEVGRAMRARYDYVERSARGMNAGFLAVLQPVAWQEPGARPLPEAELEKRLGQLPAMRANFTRMYDGMEDALKERPYFLNLRAAFAGRDYPAYEADGIHNTDQGREALAQAMLPAMRRALRR